MCINIGIHTDRQMWTNGHMCIQMGILMYVYTQMPMYMCVCSRIYLCIYIDICGYTKSCVYIHQCTYRHMYVPTSAYVYTYLRHTCVPCVHTLYKHRPLFMYIIHIQLETKCLPGIQFLSLGKKKQPAAEESI